MDDFPLEPDWAGTAVQLAQALTELLPQFALDSEPVPSERLVRFYVASGALQRPQKEGREALFGRQQAIEFLATRVLLQDGWPLAKVAQYLPTQTQDALLALIPRRPPRQTRAQELVAQFQSGTVLAPKPLLSAPSPLLTMKRQELREQAKPVQGPPGQTLFRVVLAPWCEILLQPEAMEKLTPNEFDRAVEAFRATLEGELTRKGKTKT